MSETNHSRSAGQAESGGFDHLLDAALANYSSVEPRSGLEERVLANLHSEQAQSIDHAGWRWGIAAVAALVIVVFSLMMRSGKQPLPLVKNPPIVLPGSQAPEAHRPEVARQNDNFDSPRRTPAVRHVAAPSTHEEVAAAYPRLDQFPSPQPLSEQEKLLTGYIAANPEHAGLVAEARMELLRKDQEEQQREATDDGGDVQPRDTNSR